MLVHGEGAWAFNGKALTDRTVVWPHGHNAGFIALIIMYWNPEIHMKIINGS